MLNISILCFFFFLGNAGEIKEGTYSISSHARAYLAIQGSLPIGQGGGMNAGDRILTTEDPLAIENFVIKAADDHAELYYIYAKHSGKALDEDLGQHYTQQWDAVGVPNQKWRITRVTNELYLIQGFASNRFLVAPVIGGVVMTAEMNGDDESFYWILEYTPKNFCLSLNLLSIGSVGDVDRMNEEIELEIYLALSKTKSHLNCGLFLFDLVENKDKDLRITIPCEEDGYVQIRLYERDICNDDSCLIQIQCSPTNGIQNREITIKPDSTATSYSSCTTSSHQFQACLSAGVELGPTTKNRTAGIDVSGCYVKEWGEEECATSETSETESQYTLLYTVEKYPCDLQWKGLNQSNNETCQIHSYRPSPSCDNDISPKGMGNNGKFSGLHILIMTILGLVYILNYVF